MAADQMSDPDAVGAADVDHWHAEGRREAAWFYGQEMTCEEAENMALRWHRKGKPLKVAYWQGVAAGICLLAGGGCHQ